MLTFFSKIMFQKNNSQLTRMIEQKKNKTGIVKQEPNSTKRFQTTKEISKYNE